MVRSAVISAARKVSSLIAAAPPFSRISYNCSKKSDFYKYPSILTRPAAAGDALMSKRSKFQGSSRKPIFFLSRYICDCGVLNPISVGDDGSFSSKYSIRFPYPTILTCRFDRFYSCNGLFCSPDIRDDRLFVFNPATLEFIKLPNSPHDETKGDLTLSRRFRKSNVFVATWADPESEDYKVLKFYYHLDHIFDPPRATHPAEVELYSLKTNSWEKIISKELAMFVHIPPHSRCYIDGVLYTAAMLNNSTLLSILPFDFRSETFLTALPFPEFGFAKSYKLVKYDGKLSLLSRHHPDYNKFVHWVMRNGEWFREAEYDTKCCRDGLEPIGFVKNDELLLFEGIIEKQTKHYRQLMVFDSSTGEFRQVPGFASMYNHRLYEFGETFVKLKSSSGDLEEEEEEVSYFGDFYSVPSSCVEEMEDRYSDSDDEYQCSPCDDERDADFARLKAIVDEHNEIDFEDPDFNAKMTAKVEEYFSKFDEC